MPEQLIQYLVQAAAQGEGYYLLNIGPMPSGHMRTEEIERLTMVGQWLKRNPGN